MPILYGHCERGHFHGNEDSDDCPVCNHPSEYGECEAIDRDGDQCKAIVCGERFCDDHRFDIEHDTGRWFATVDDLRRWREED
jgi:hypothetical protein